MANVILKNKNGEDVVYEGVKTIALNTSDGGKQVFSEGEAVENVQIAVDFREGDQTVNAPDGTLVKSAVLQKPAGLIPENIKAGETVAGVEGTYKVTLVPVSVTENGTYYPTGNVEIGGTYTFKDSYTQEELSTLYNMSSRFDEGDAVLFADDTAGVALLVMLTGMLAVVNGEEVSMYVGAEVASQIGLSEGWYENGETPIALESPPTFTFLETGTSYVDEMMSLNTLFALLSADGFSSVEVNVQAKTENITVALDFSAGDMTIVPTDDHLITRVDIPMPESLVPENIKEGEAVAGIIGTYKGGAKPVSICGSYEIDSSVAVNDYGVCVDPITIQHSLGVLPDYISIVGKEYASGALLSLTAFNEKIPVSEYTQRGCFYISSRQYSVNAASSMYSREPASNGVISRATPKTFTVGGNILGHVSGASYQYTVVGGLLENDYLYIELSLDGDGHLLINGGTPEILQYKIYVDGVLAKTVNNTVANNETLVVDISDVASEWKIYTLSVEAVSDSSKLIVSDEVSGYTTSLTGVCGDAANWKLNNGTLTIYGEGAIYDYTIASDNVTIDQPWFDFASLITAVRIEDGITRVGNQSLRGLTNLTDLSIGETVTHIGTSAFLRCTSLTELTLPVSISNISSYAFNEDTALKTVRYNGTLDQWLDIAFSATSANPCFTGKAALYIDGELCESIRVDKDIQYAAFSGCSSIKAVDASIGVGSIGSYAFYQCANLERVQIDENSAISAIAGHSFRTCQKLAYINIPVSVTSIGSYAFADDVSLSEITIPDGVTTINDYAFYNCKKLASVTLSAALIDIKQYAFAYCAALTSIVIPDDVREILWRAFQSCTSLASVTLGSSVKLIGDNTFNSCSKLTYAKFNDTTTWVRNSSQTSTTGTTLSSSSLANTSTAATYLRSTYVGYWWHKN